MVLVDKILIAIGIDPKGAQEGLDRIDHHIDHTDNKIKDLQNHAKGAAKHMIMSLAAPLLAAFSVGKVIQGYISDVAQVAEQTGAYSKQLEEARLKQAMLQRVTKEDVELYKRGREALVKFQIATADFGAALVRTAMPALKWLLDKLNGFTDWFSHNQNNIIRFLQVLASVITVALIPSVVKFTAALLKNPLVWVAGLVLALALAIDDLVVYLQGGRSEFDAFWKWLGLTKGDTETLTKAINRLKTSGVDLLKTIGKVTAAFVAMRAVASVLMIVQKAWNALSLSILANPIVLAIGLLIAAGWMLYKNWDGVCEGIAALLETLTNAWQKAVDWTADLFQSIDDGAHALVNDAGEVWDGLVNRVSHVFGLIANILSAFQAIASEKLAAAGDAIGGAFTSALNTVNGVWQGMKDGASALAEDVGSALAGAWQGMKEGAAAVGETVGNAFTAAGRFIARTWEGVKEGAAAVCESVGGFFSGTWQGISDGAADAGDAIGRWLSAAGNTVKRGWQNISEGAAAVGETISDVFDSAGELIAGTWEGVKDGAFSLADDIGSALGSVWQAVSEGASGAGGAIGSALDSAAALASSAWQGIKDGVSALSSDIGSAFGSALDTVSGVWQGMKDGAGALVDDIEGVFSGLVSWFSNLWSKITGIFDSALGGIKDGISAVAETLGFGGDGGEDTPKDKYATMSDGEMAKRKAEIAETKRRKAEERQAGAAAPAREKVTIRDRVTPVIIGAGRASAVRAPAVNSTAVSSVRNSTSTSRVTNDNRRQEVNINIQGNADRGTARQIGTSVTDVFKSGAMSPVAG